MRPLPRKLVLVIEDDHDLREVFAVALRNAGFAVSEAADGVDALRSVDHTPPDAVALDLMLPTLDGNSVADELAAHTSTRRVPVVVVTGSSLHVNGLNVTAILRKPVAPGFLVAAVRNAVWAAAR